MGLHSVSAALKFYCRYRVKYARPYGANFEFRLRNQIRRKFAFVAAFRTHTSIHLSKELITKVIKDVYPIKILTQKIKVLSQTVKKLATLRSRVLGMRLYRKQFFLSLFDKELRFLIVLFLED
jgi:hypothetical protein